jgi:hypothetical protein
MNAVNSVARPAAAAQTDFARLVFEERARAQRQPDSLPSPPTAELQDFTESELDAAKKAGRIGFMHRALCTATLPHSAVEGNEFHRENGFIKLSLFSPIGLPYGPKPRLIILDFAQRAREQRHREITLGRSMREWMLALDIAPCGGRERGQLRPTRLQMDRLLASTMTLVMRDGHRTVTRKQDIGDADILWNPVSPEQAALWPSTVTLSEKFYEEVTKNGVPVNMQTITRLRRSALAIDIYTWLTHRYSFLEAPLFLRWSGLRLQFGSDYRELKHFKFDFKRRLAEVAGEYAQARFRLEDGGLWLFPSPTHVLPTRTLHRRGVAARPGA